ncbi:uncharacterized protein HD556DRAFT_120349 [Suillus plorans]|uniref:Uncharacterized protein n=1 Tax=Suillus plorans TaxID=116603 RepID=A0A9P7DNK3_9AGAM|nr:uncharacterized protein HD556DRAFT_120349 [Suillus plorans]KAG1799309.1 hypothetical protein HD556DRAFT_120349 [Suillus plorans]
MKDRQSLEAIAMRRIIRASDLHYLGTTLDLLKSCYFHSCARYRPRTKRSGQEISCYLCVPARQPDNVPSTLIIIPPTANLNTNLRPLPLNETHFLSPRCTPWTRAMVSSGRSYFVESPFSATQYPQACLSLSEKFDSVQSLASAGAKLVFIQ